MYSSPTAECEWVLCYLWCSMFLMQRYAATRLPFAMMQYRQRLGSLSQFFPAVPVYCVLYSNELRQWGYQVVTQTPDQIHPRTSCPAVMPVLKPLVPHILTNNLPPQEPKDLFESNGKNKWKRLILLPLFYRQGARLRKVSQTLTAAANSHIISNSMVSVSSKSTN